MWLPWQQIISNVEYSSVISSSQTFSPFGWMVQLSQTSSQSLLVSNNLSHCPSIFVMLFQINIKSVAIFTFRKIIHILLFQSLQQLAPWKVLHLIHQTAPCTLQATLIPPLIVWKLILLVDKQRGVYRNWFSYLQVIIQGP